MMKVSSVKDLYNQIERYIRTHGRLVFGATVLLCLICYLGWRESAWSEVEQLESPIQSHRESNRAEGGKQGNTGTDSVSSEASSRKKHTAQKGKQSIMKDSSIKEELSNGTLVFPIRNVLRPYPLVDTFSKELVGAKEKGILGADSSGIDTKEKEIRRGRHTKEGNTDHVYQPLEIKRTSKHHDRVHYQAPVVHVLGIVYGDAPVAILEINGNTYTVYEGEQAEGVQVITIGEAKVQVQMNGSSRWIE